jgi:hypothetical protein
MHEKGLKSFLKIIKYIMSYHTKLNLSQVIKLNKFILYSLFFCINDGTKFLIERNLYFHAHN